MTLILGLMTRDFICHVSDRQLTDARTGRPLASRAAKTVIWPERGLLASYTGIARVTAGETTEDWLMQALWKAATSADFHGSIATAADEVFANIRSPPRFKRHGFLIHSWLDDGVILQPLEPFPAGMDGRAIDGLCTYVTNTLDLVRGIERTDSGRFVHRSRPLLASERFSVFAAGQNLNCEESEQLDDTIAAALRSPGGGVRAAAVAMMKVVERVSSRSPYVGGGVFICAIPRGFKVTTHGDTVGLNIGGVRWGLPEDGISTFIHIPEKPTNRVGSPGIIHDPFAMRAELIVRKGRIPDPTGAHEVPEEGEMRMNCIALRSSDEVARLTVNSPSESGGG